MRIFLFHVNIHQNVNSTQRSFNHCVERMIGSIVTISLSPAIVLLVKGLLFRAAFHAQLNYTDLNFLQLTRPWLPLSAQYAAVPQGHHLPGSTH